MCNSPYMNKDTNQWKSITQKLVCDFPIETNELKDIILTCWQDIFKSKLGKLKIGEEIKPNPQTMSFFLHELIAYYISKKYPHKFRLGKGNKEKDIHCIEDTCYSIEIKASSDSNKIFGNRSYASGEDNSKRKSKDGYFIVINFDKFKDDNTPKILKIRFGYLEWSDWKAQKSETGQQASLSKDAYDNKLILLYEYPKKA